MNEKFILILFLLLSINCLKAQHISPHREGVSASDYNKWLKRGLSFQKMLYKSDKELSSKSKILILVNLSTAYYILKEPTDSVYQKLNEALLVDKYMGCYLLESLNNMSAIAKIPKIEDRVSEEQWSNLMNECEAELKKYHAEQDKAITDEYTLNKDVYDFDLIEQLEKFFEQDQSIRNEWFKMRREYGTKSKEEIAISQKMQFQDSLNLLEVKKIIQEYGYPGKSLVGTKYQDVAMWIIHHASDNNVRDKYFHLLYDTATKGEIDKNAFKLFIDRVHMIKFGTQLYGTQSEYNSETKTYDMVEIEDRENYEQRFKDLAEGKFDLGRINLEDYESN